MASLDRFFLALMVLFSAVVSLPFFVTLPSNLASVLPLLPWGLFACALLLSQIYQQGRMGFLVLLSLASYGVSIQVNDLGVDTAAWQFCYLAWGMAMPLILLLFAVLPARLVFHRRAVGHWLLLLGLAGAAMALPQLSDIPMQISPWLAARNQPLFSWSPAPLLILLVQAIVTLLCWVQYLLSKRHDDAALTATQLSILLFTLWFDSSLQLALTASVLASIQLLLVLGLGHQLAFIDELTAIPGRRALNMALARQGRRYTLAMMDIDHFKQFNDTHGHDVGDEVLKMVAQQLTLVGAGGKVFRFGGEEFTVLFAGKHPKQVKDALEEIREAVAEYPFVVRSAKSRPDENKAGRNKRGSGGGKTVQVTISLGVANRTSERKETDEVLKAADKALYAAKKAGRNCLKVAPKVDA